MLALAFAAAAFVPWNEGDDYTTGTLAGNGVRGRQDGSNATFAVPVALALDSVTDTLYVADQADAVVVGGGDGAALSHC